MADDLGLESMFEDSETPKKGRPRKDFGLESAFKDTEVPRGRPRKAVEDIDTLEYTPAEDLAKPTKQQLRDEEKALLEGARYQRAVKSIPEVEYQDLKRDDEPLPRNYWESVFGRATGLKAEYDEAARREESRRKQLRKEEKLREDAQAEDFGIETIAYGKYPKAQEAKYEKMISPEEVKAIEDAEWRKIGQYANVPKQVVETIAKAPDAVVRAKGSASEMKLKWEASKYGITSDDFERLKKEPGGLKTVSMWVAMGKKSDQALQSEKAREEKNKALTENIRSSTVKRYAETEARYPPGGRKLVQFGSTGFGQNPIYMNAYGTHGSVRSQYVPGQMTGVATGLANSRLEMARMKQRVLGGAGTRPDVVQVLQPTASPQKVISRLSSTPWTSGWQPSILQKLGFKKKPPYR